MMKISDIEKIFDDRYSKVRIPADSRDLAKWLISTISEDSLLILSKSEKSNHLISVLADKFKYSIKYAFSRIDSELDTKNGAIQHIITSGQYEETNKILIAGIDFYSANLICSLVHEGLASYSCKGELIELKDLGFWKKPAYSVLEMTALERSQQEYTFEKFISIFNFPIDTKFHNALKDQCEVFEGVISYKFDPDLCKEFSKSIPVFKQSIPDDWIFPWSSGLVSKRLLWALSVRCTFHLTTIRKAASYFSVQGGGLESLCMLTDEQTLAFELSELCGVEHGNALSFVRALSLGEGTRTADPALQPLIKLSDGRLIIGCLNVLTNRQDRNLLSLHARVCKKSFDNQSSVFEQLMISKIQSSPKNRMFILKPNFHIPGAKEVGDLDVVFCDTRSKVILVCELRWVIQPGDPREIMTKARACIEKVGKITRKVEKARERIQGILDVTLQPGVDKSEWSVKGVILIDGYAGVESTDPNFPIMPLDIFIEGMKFFTRLDRLHAWAESLKWLPQNNIHYTCETKSDDFGVIKVNRPGFAIKSTSRDFISFIKDGIKKMK